MTGAPDPARDRGLRWRTALIFALLSGLYAAARVWHEPHWPTDFDQLWHAAQALVHGRDPYSVVGPGREFPWLWPLYYPLPAVLYSVPFTLLSLPAARVAFSAVAAGVLGWSLGPRVRTHWPLLLSAAYIISISRTQWAPLLLASAWTPLLAFVVMAKPNVGLASLAALDRRGLLVAAAGILVAAVASFLAWPAWFGAWREAVAVSPHILAPAFLPGGFVLLLAVLRWRRPDARLFLALAIVPHTPSLYDLLLLFFACRTLRDSVGLAMLTHAMYWSIVFFGSFDTFDAYALWLGSVAVFVVRLPVLVAILLRPNVAVDPPHAPEEGGWRSFLPQNRPDAALLAVLVFVSAFLVWLPLSTYR